MSRTIAQRTNRSRRDRGFTLIELLLVLVILGILAAVVVPKFTNRSEDARIMAARTDIANMGNALDTFEIEAGRYPTSDEGVGALLQAPSSVRAWKGPYLNKFPVDPWGNPYVYRYPGQHNVNGYDLHSMGPDGRDGGDDIDNWTQH